MTRSFRKDASIAVFAVSFSILSTSSYAFSPEAQQMCTGDAFRLCSSEIPDIPRITACMVRNHDNLSSGCRAVMDSESQQTTVVQQPPSTQPRPVAQPAPAVASKSSITKASSISKARKPPLG
jgi:hypothetical protein